MCRGSRPCRTHTIAQRCQRMCSLLASVRDSAVVPTHMLARVGEGTIKGSSCQACMNLMHHNKLSKKAVFTLSTPVFLSNTRVHYRAFRQTSHKNFKVLLIWCALGFTIDQNTRFSQLTKTPTPTHLMKKRGRKRGKIGKIGFNENQQTTQRIKTRGVSSVIAVTEVDGCW